MATQTEIQETDSNLWRINLCPRGCDSILRPYFDELKCLQCGYEGDGSLPHRGDDMEGNAAGWDSEIFPQTYTITIYRCEHYYTAKPEFESLDLNITVQETTVATQKKGKKWRLLGIYGGSGAFWADDLAPQTRKSGGMRKGGVTIRTELRQAILDAICVRLEATPEEITGALSVIQADTVTHKKNYDRNNRASLNGLNGQHNGRIT